MLNLYRQSVNRPRRLLPAAGFLLLVCAFCACATQTPAPPSGPFPDLEESRDAALQCGLTQLTGRLNLSPLLERGDMGVAIADISNLQRPRYAGLNDGKMMYAASLPKIAILFATLKQVDQGRRAWDAQTAELARAMIQDSSNSAATTLYQQVGPAYINSLLASPPYSLYSFSRGGGLWVGKEYGQGAPWLRDPLQNISHAASPLKAVHFYYLLESGRLLSPTQSETMRQILSHSSLHHKFYKGLRRCCPQAAVYRKGGSWGDFQADSVLVYHQRRRYIAVALVRNPAGAALLEQLIIEIDRLIAQPDPCRPLLARQT